MKMKVRVKKPPNLIINLVLMKEADNFPGSERNRKARKASVEKQNQ